MTIDQLKQVLDVFPGDTIVLIHGEAQESEYFFDVEPPELRQVPGKQLFDARRHGNPTVITAVVL